MSNKISYSLEEYKAILRESFDSTVDSYFVEERYFPIIGKYLPLDKVEKVICLTSESNIEGEYEVAEVFSILSKNIPVLGREEGFEDGLIIYKPINLIGNKAYIVEQLIPGMTSIDIFIVKD